jgi:putative aldouronate transport system substrate-binding protein
MKKKLKLWSALLICSMLVLSACSGNNGNSNSSNGEAPTESSPSTEKPTELTVAFPFFGQAPKDMSLVQDEINKITQKKINATVKLLPIGFGDWQQQTNLMFSSGESLDLLPTIWNYPSLVSKGQFIPLDELLQKHGQGIIQEVDSTYLEAAKVNGVIYAVPTLRDMASSFGIAMRKDLLDKYKIDTSQIKRFEDIEGVLKTIKAGEPDLSPLVTSVGSSLLSQYQPYDMLGDQLGVLPNFDNDLKVVNLYESDEYARDLQTVRKWYEEGLILKDAATNKTTQYDLIRSNKAFAYLLRVQPLTFTGETQNNGQPMEVVTFSEPVATTSTITNAMWGIASNSETPDKAMEFLNLMYSDKEIINLLIWGIEGKHYEVKTGNLIGFPEGVDAQTSGYFINLGWLFGNQFLSYVWDGPGVDPDIWEKMKEFNKSAVKSKALGFSFDSSSVKTEVANVGNAITQYSMPLETGSVDPEKVLSEFNKKLKTAGIDKIIAEKQKQLDEWAQKNK